MLDLGWPYYIVICVDLISARNVILFHGSIMLKWVSFDFFLLVSLTDVDYKGVHRRILYAINGMRYGNATVDSA